MSIIGYYCYRTTIKDLINTDEETWSSAMDDNYYKVDRNHYWSSRAHKSKTDYETLLRALKELPEEYGDLHVIFDYVLPLANPEVMDESKDEGMRIDTLILGADKVMILDFKYLTCSKPLNTSYRDRMMKCRRRLWAWHEESMCMSIGAALVFAGRGGESYYRRKDDKAMCTGMRLGEAIMDFFGDEPVARSEEEVLKWLESDFIDPQKYTVDTEVKKPGVCMSNRITVNDEWYMELPGAEDFMVEVENEREVTGDSYGDLINALKVDDDRQKPDPIVIRAVRRDICMDPDEDSWISDDSEYIIEARITSGVKNEDYPPRQRRRDTDWGLDRIKSLKENIDFDIYGTGADYAVGLSFSKGSYRPMEALIEIVGTEIEDGLISFRIIPEDVSYNELRRAEEYIKNIAEHVGVIKRSRAQAEVDEEERTPEAVSDEETFDIDNEGILRSYKGNVRRLIVPEGVKAIDDEVFKGNIRIDHVILPYTLERIGAGAFENCRQLTEIIIPYGVKAIGRKVFMGCGNIYDVRLPDTLEEIGEGAFSYCSNLRSIRISGKLRTIPKEGFLSCPQLKSVEIEGGVEIIGEKAFAECARLKSIELPGSLYHVGDRAFFRCSSLKKVIYHGRLDRIEPYTFCDCHDLAELVLPEELKEIGENAFEECWSLHQIDLPETVARIGERAFYKANIWQIEIPKNTKYIKDEAFRECPDLEIVRIHGNVRGIGRGAFAESGLRKITLPARMDEIKEEAFSGCEFLEEIVLPDGIRLIKEDTFSGCKNLRRIIIPKSVIWIEADAFNGCRKLRDVVLPKGMEQIGESAFSWCESLRQIDLPETLRQIEEGAFNGSGLRTIRIPDSVTELGEKIFEYCDDLERIELGTGVDWSWPDAFRGCDGLREIVCTREIFDSAEEYALEELEGVEFSIVDEA